MIRKYISFFLLLVFATTSVVAQGPGDGGNRNHHRQWLEEMRQLRTNFMVNELELTPEQKEKFVPLYQNMTIELEKVTNDTRSMVFTVAKKGAAATDVELEKASEAAFECKGKESAIEMKYFKKFKSILTPRQLFKFKNAEQDFYRQLIDKRKRNNRRR